ncbi:MAG TPA: GAF domain-containing protein, partial [Anaerolineae bacterium]
FIALYDPATTELDFRIRVDEGIREPVQRRLLSAGLTSYVVDTKQPLLIHHYDDEKDRWPAAKIWGTMRAPQSWLGVPMLLGDRLVGIISVQAYRPHAYAQSEQELLSTIADTVVLAVENARLFGETARRAEQLATLREIDNTLSSMLDLPSMLEATLVQLEQIIPCQSSAVFLLDGNHLCAAAARGREQSHLANYALDISNNAIFHEMESKRAPVIIDDLNESREWSVVAGLEFARSWLGAPLVARGTVIGQIAIFGETPGAFTREHADLMLSFANHAGIAIANARLHESMQRNSERFALLNTIARTVGSTIELDELLETCLNQLVQVIHADSYYIGLHDPKEDTIDLRIHYDAGERFPPSKLRVGVGLSSLVLRGRRPILFHHLSEELATLPIQPIVGGSGRISESWLGVPMTTGDQLIGLLAFASYQPEAFDEEDVALLVGVASQVAIAVDNARHHAEVEEQARHDSLTEALNHGAFIAELNAAAAETESRGQTLAMIMIDLDNFKSYNDRFGHVVGDMVLRATVQAIRTHLKHTDFVGRWGGEEFAIGLRDADIERANRVAKRIRETLAVTLVQDQLGRAIPPATVSQGIAALPETTTYVDQLIEEADRALYRAKALGRDQIATAKQETRKDELPAER